MGAAFDLVIIGSGPGGYRAAVLGALRGLKVAVVEKGEWGGCCLNRGCVPKKDWHHSAKLIAASRGFESRGIRGQLRGDLAGAWRHQRAVVEQVRASYVDYLGRLGVGTYRGAARVVGPGRVQVGDAQALEARHVLIATGSVPKVPAPYAREPGRVLTTDDLFDFPPPPGRRVAVVGSGVTGTELAFILAMLGCEVLWLTHAEPLSRSRYSAPALRALRQALADSGVVPVTRSRAAAAETGSDGVLLALPQGRRELVDWVLLCAGRAPCTAELGIEAAGIETDAQGFIVVDERQRTSLEGVYAIGDVANPAMTSNHALAEAAVAVADMLRAGSRRSDPDAVPEALYSALELARYGLGEDEAEDRGLEPAVGFAAFQVNPAALGEDAAQGFVRLLADMDSGRLLGGEVAGEGAADLIHLLAGAACRDDGLAALAGLAWNHPTRSEEFLNAVETLAAKWGLQGKVWADGR